MTNVELEKEFRKRFNRDAERMFFCPGRVNLIGEHIDYNGGQVMPCAISSGTWLLLAQNTDQVFRFECVNFPGNSIIDDLQSSYSKTGKEWFNYPLGMIHQLLTGRPYCFRSGHAFLWQPSHWCRSFFFCFY